MYKDDGDFTVTLTVRDPSGATSTASTTATIANVATTGTAATQGALPPLAPTDLKTGTFKAQLTATDKDGKPATSTPITVTVTP